MPIAFKEKGVSDQGTFLGYSEISKVWFFFLKKKSNWQLLWCDQSLSVVYVLKKLLALLIATVAF